MNDLPLDLRARLHRHHAVRLDRTWSITAEQYRPLAEYQHHHSSRCWKCPGHRGTSTAISLCQSHARFEVVINIMPDDRSTRPIDGCPLLIPQRFWRTRQERSCDYCAKATRQRSAVQHGRSCAAACIRECTKNWSGDGSESNLYEWEWGSTALLALYFRWSHLSGALGEGKGKECLSFHIASLGRSPFLQRSRGLLRNLTTFLAF